MRIIIFLALIIGIIFSASTVMANPVYMGFDYKYMNYREPGFSTNPTALGIRLGVDLNDYLAIESRAGFGISSGTTYLNWADIDLDLDYAAGLYLRGGVPNNGIKPYAIIGMTSARATASSLGVSFSAEETDLSYGLGVELLCGEDITIFLEHVRLIDKDFFELSSSNFGLNFHF